MIRVKYITEEQWWWSVRRSRHPNGGVCRRRLFIFANWLNDDMDRVIDGPSFISSDYNLGIWFPNIQFNACDWKIDIPALLNDGQTSLLWENLFTTTLILLLLHLNKIIICCCKSYGDGILLGNWGTHSNRNHKGPICQRASLEDSAGHRMRIHQSGQGQFLATS